MVKVPPDGLFYAFFELEGWPPAKFGLQLGAVDGITGIVTETVRYIGNESQTMSFRMTKDTVHCLYHHLDQVNILPFVESTDIVCFSVLSFVENEVNGTGVVFHIKPVADILTFAVDRKRFSVTDVIDEQWDELFRELIRAIVVRAVGNDCRKAVCVVEGADEMV